MFKVGDRVRYSGKFMRSCGIIDGTRTWVIQDCSCGLCASGNHVALDEQDIDASSMPSLRHISIAAIERDSHYVRKA